MANQFDLRKFLNENKLTRASRALNEVDTRNEAEQDAKVFHEDLVDKYGFDAVANALEALYDNAEEGGAGYENIADHLKMDNSMLVDMIKDNLMNEAPANRAIAEGNSFDLKKFLNENKLTRASRAVNEAAGGMVKLFDFPDLDSPDHEQYERLGFTVREDDEANNVAYAEMIVTPDDPTSSVDWMSIMQVLEDAQSFGLAPHMEYMGKMYSTKEAYQLADEKASATL